MGCCLYKGVKFLVSFLPKIYFGAGRAEMHYCVHSCSFPSWHSFPLVWQSGRIGNFTLTVNDTSSLLVCPYRQFRDMQGFRVLVFFVSQFGAVVSCPEPAKPSFGLVSPGGKTYGMRRTFNCRTGYSLRGSKSRICQGDGKWSGSKTTCTSKDPLRTDVTVTAR